MEILPGAYKIDDIMSGRVSPETLYSEIDTLKAEINLLRNGMSQFLKALATIPEGRGQQEYYAQLAEQTQHVKAAIKEYCAKYDRLVAIINLAQIKLGQDPETGRTGQQLPKRKRSSMSKT